MCHLLPSFWIFCPSMPSKRDISGFVWPPMILVAFIQRLVAATRVVLLLAEFTACIRSAGPAKNCGKAVEIVSQGSEVALGFGVVGGG